MKGNKGLPLTALVVCMLGIAACAGEEKAGMPAQLEETGEEVQGEEQTEEVLREDREPEETGERGEQDGERGEQDGERTEEGQKDADGKVDGGIYVHSEEEAQEYKAEDGTVLLTMEKILPVVVILGNEQAAEAINAYVRGENVFGWESMFGVSEEEAVKWAEEHYISYGKETWPIPYELSAGYYVGRMDDRIISFVLTAYSYMGGAHPNAYEKGITFDAQTGKRLMLEDVAIDKEEASAAVLEFLLEETKKEKYQNVFFGGYEKYLPDLVSEDTWFLGEDGFHIIANAYSIAPYVAGSFDFLIPYEEADFLKPIAGAKP